MVDGEIREIKTKDYQELQEKIKRIAHLPVVKSNLKVSEWFEDWLENYIKPLKKPATYEQYYFIYKTHIKPVLGKRQMKTIKSFDIQKVISTMNTAGYATKTMKHAKTVMSGAFSKAFKDKIIPENPVVDIEIPKKQAKPRKTLTTEELGKIFKAMENSRWIWSVKFMLVTGLRRGELLALKWTDIDWENRRIIIDESNSSTGLGDTKNSKVHYVPLSAKAIEYLDKQIEMLKQESNPLIFNKNLTQNKDIKNTNFLIFPTQRGTPISPNTYYHTISRFAAKAGIKASPHCLRHTFVYMMRKKLSLKELQEILGHDESTTTLDIYGEMINDSVEKTASEIDDVFSQVEYELEKVKAEIRKEKCKIINFMERRRAK